MLAHGLLFIDRDLRISRYMEDYTNCLRSTGFFLGARDTSLEISGSRCKNHGAPDRGALRKSSQLAHSFHSVGIVACWILAPWFTDPGSLASSTTSLSGKCCLHFPFLCILHCYCTPWSWSRVLVSLALQRSPTGFSSHYVFQTTQSNIIRPSYIKLEYYIS